MGQLPVDDRTETVDGLETYVYKSIVTNVPIIGCRSAGMRSTNRIGVLRSIGISKTVAGCTLLFPVSSRSILTSRLRT